jgi:hypothetical protein
MEGFGIALQICECKTLQKQGCKPEEWNLLYDDIILYSQLCPVGLQSRPAEPRPTARVGLRRNFVSVSLQSLHFREFRAFFLLVVRLKSWVTPPFLINTHCLPRVVYSIVFSLCVICLRNSFLHNQSHPKISSKHFHYNIPQIWKSITDLYIRRPALTLNMNSEGLSKLIFDSDGYLNNRVTIFQKLLYS